MKATLDIPDDLYKRVKARSAMEGKSIRSVAIELFQLWIQTPSDTGSQNESVSLSTEDYKKYPWLELARRYKNGNQSSDFKEIKKSIAKGWAKETGVDGEVVNEQ
jgi:asparagine synthetase B (glutamine-hydrolysing)